MRQESQIHFDGHTHGISADAGWPWRSGDSLNGSIVTVTTLGFNSPFPAPENASTRNPGGPGKIKLLRTDRFGPCLSRTMCEGHPTRSKRTVWSLVRVRSAEVGVLPTVFPSTETVAPSGYELKRTFCVGPLPVAIVPQPPNANMAAAMSRRVIQRVRRIRIVGRVQFTFRGGQFRRENETCVLTFRPSAD